jgi:hypothetical protein
MTLSHGMHIYCRSVLMFVVFRCLDGNDLISCITSLPPTAELVPHMRLVNPDFLWWHHFESGIKDKINDIWMWLKVSPNVVIINY